MKFVIVIICLFLQPMSFAKKNRNEKYIYPLDHREIKLNNLLNWSTNQFNAQSRLKEIKYHIINGNLDLAKIMLSQTTLSINFTKQIQYRYLALVHFIEGNYELVIKALEPKEMQDFTTQAKFCLLKVLSLIILERPHQAKNEWAICKTAIKPHSTNDLTWIQTIVDLKTTNDKDYIENYFNNIQVDNLDKKMLRVYLKLALYLNQQDKIISRFKFFGSSPLESIMERELIGLNYYRNGNLVKAYKILEKLNTANAEVFKGNLYLHQKKYEPAYAQFKLALQRKSNSQNALERLIPLAWKLQQYNEGISFLKRLRVNNHQNLEYDTLMAVFQTMANDFDQASYYLKRIHKKTNLSGPIEVSQVKVLNFLKKEKYEDVLDPAFQSCAGNDGINCWLIIALHSWEGLIELLGQESLIHDKLTPLSKKYNQESILPSFNDEKLLEQKAIEELDNNLIQF